MKKICECCGKEFETPTKKQRYCSLECREEANRRRTAQKYAEEKAKIEAIKRAQAEREAFRQTDHALFDQRAKEQKETGLSYGQIQARKYAKLVKIERKNNATIYT